MIGRAENFQNSRKKTDFVLYIVTESEFCVSFVFLVPFSDALHQKK